MAFGSITSYQQLHLFNFSSTSDHFEFPLLLEQIAPHAAWQFLPYLAPYVPLLSNFPSLTIFDNISSPLTLLLYLLHLVDLSFLFPYYPTHCLNGFHRCLKVLKIPLCGTLLPSRSFQGTSPSFDMLIFWLHLHNKYQEARELPPLPLVLLSWYTPGSLPTSPDILFCPINQVPPAESIISSLCPHIFVPNTSKDINVEHYGVVLGRPSELFFDFDPKAIVPHPIVYP